MDASRVGMKTGDSSSSLRPCRIRQDQTDHKDAIFGSENDSYKNDVAGSTLGRFPANLLLSHNPDCVELGTREVKGSLLNHVCTDGNIYGAYKPQLRQGHTDSNGLETVPHWACEENCAVAELDRQSGVSTARPHKNKTFGPSGWKNSSNNEAYSPYSDTGGASRFFYCAKASKRDRGEGNVHPTVKNTKLMEYLITLITPPGGLVLDPFAGSGSTGVAAKRLGFGFVGIEREAEYFEIACKRVDAEAKEHE